MIQITKEDCFIEECDRYWSSYHCRQTFIRETCPVIWYDAMSLRPENFGWM